MKEVKSPKKPLIYYYSIIILIVLLFNVFVAPLLMKNQVEEVDYGTFMRMIDERNIGEVEVEDDEIVFTDKDKQQVYTTGAMDDPTLTQRLYDAGATFTKQVQQTTSPVLSFILSTLVPLLIFFGIGQYLSKKLVESAGGKNSLMFGGAGKSSAKVYVQSTQGIHFNDVAGEDELSVAALDAETLSLGIAAVLSRTHTFLMSEKLNINLKHRVAPPYL